MSVAPTDLARKRWRPVRKAFEKQEKLSLELTQAGERLSALQVELQQAAKEDREAYAEAIAAGRDEPPRKAEQLAVRIDAEQRRVDACVRAVENASDEVDKLRAENAMPWRRDVLGKITEAHGAYEASIREVERCREALADEVALHGWITDGIGVSPVRDALSGRTAEGREPLSFGRVLRELTEDAGQIATYLRDLPGPVSARSIMRGAEALVGPDVTREEALNQAGRPRSRSSTCRASRSRSATRSFIHQRGHPRGRRATASGRFPRSSRQPTTSMRSSRPFGSKRMAPNDLGPGP
ncbi:MAG: hypothetical protein H0V79_07770 [Actinobacteria bacterium]|nr:hypothetical protein [Actinomycetota bacterium]